MGNKKNSEKRGNNSERRDNNTERRRNNSEKRGNNLKRSTNLSSTFLSHRTYENVLIYEFFMPLRNESGLKQSLDALFYRDSLLDRLKKVKTQRLLKLIPKSDNETMESYYERILKWISKRFTGYSITHNYGRFKLGDLASYNKAASIMRQGNTYLADETTAIVRFIFPCGIPLKKPIYFDFNAEDPAQIKDYNKYDDSDLEFLVMEDLNDPLKEAVLIRFFFNLLFVENILKAVNGEHEIWMLETGMRTRLHVWNVYERNRT